MCLSLAIKRPSDVLAKGEHVGFEWNIVHNGRGYRCGYVKVLPNHPWHGKSYDDIDVDVHGGLTFADNDVPCDTGGTDDGYWVGFDCAHGSDAPDPALPTDSNYRHAMAEVLVMFPARDCQIRTQEYVEAECRSLCEQAAKAAP